MKKRYTYPLVNRLLLLLEVSTLPFALCYSSVLAGESVPESHFAPTPPTRRRTVVRGTEWKQLPRQSWEMTVHVPEKPGPQKILDQVKSKVNLGFEASLFPSSEKLNPLGHIIGSNSESTYLGLYDLVYIEAKETLKVDSIYGIAPAPETLKSPRTGRKVFSYFISGRIKILGTKDDLYLGRIMANTDIISRGSLLIPMPPKVPELVPIAGSKATEALVIIDHRISTFATAQHKEVLIDKGSNDGIKPGMVFRAFDYFDPANKKKLTDSNLTIIADIMVTQVSTTFSSAVILHSRSTVTDFAKVVLLTDISDLKKYPQFDFKKQSGEDNLEDLDQLDDGLKMKTEEKKKLNQLEKWKKNPPKESNDPLKDPIDSLDASKDPNKEDDTTQDTSPPAPLPLQDSDLDAPGLDPLDEPVPSLSTSQPPPSTLSPEESSAPLTPTETSPPTTATGTTDALPPPDTSLSEPASDSPETSSESEVSAPPPAAPSASEDADLVPPDLE